MGWGSDRWWSSFCPRAPIAGAVRPFVLSSRACCVSRSVPPRWDAGDVDLKQLTEIDRLSVEIPVLGVVVEDPTEGKGRSCAVVDVVFEGQFRPVGRKPDDAVVAAQTIGREFPSRCDFAGGLVHHSLSVEPMDVQVLDG